MMLGTDPEWFVKELSGRIVPVCGKLGGTKDKPLPLGSSDGFFYHEDNVCVELSVPPAPDEFSATDNLIHGIKLLDEKLKEAGLRRNNVRVSHRFNRADLTSRQANQFGCDPDYDAYTGGLDTRAPLDPATIGGMRFAGGHIHLGGSFNCPPFVVALLADLVLGTRVQKPNGARAEYYGRPGVYRVKPYGVEYRRPSNSWVRNQDTIFDTYSRMRHLGQFLEGTPATQIKKLMESIDWLVVQEYLTSRPTSALSNNFEAQRKVARRAGLHA